MSTYLVPDSFNKRTYVERFELCLLCETRHEKKKMFQIDGCLLCNECKEQLLEVV